MELKWYYKEEFPIQFDILYDITEARQSDEFKQIMTELSYLDTSTRGISLTLNPDEHCCSITITNNGFLNALAAFYSDGENEYEKQLFNFLEERREVFEKKFNDEYKKATQNEI